MFLDYGYPVQLRLVIRQVCYFYTNQQMSRPYHLQITVAYYYRQRSVGSFFKHCNGGFHLIGLVNMPRPTSGTTGPVHEVYLLANPI